MIKQVSSNKALQAFKKRFSPSEKEVQLLTDKRTGAAYCECHIKADKLIKLGTTDAPLDPDEQAEYRANRQIVENAPAFEKMKDDASRGRSFSNIVAEYDTDIDASVPLKIIGGQHRFQAIKLALKNKVNESHGIKVYFNLDNEQRLDVQLISNTNIAISGDLFDRMHETNVGPELRDWCQHVQLLDQGEDFTDRRSRGGPFSVQFARTFILNFYAGTEIQDKDFQSVETTPALCATGQIDKDWDQLRVNKRKFWTDEALCEAGIQYAKLIASQRAAFANQASKVPTDYPEKALNHAVLAAWAFTAGALANNKVRLKRHFELSTTGKPDPMNAAALARAQHKTDPDTYRGLGYRTDAKERGRLAELFYLQAEDGSGISKRIIEVAIAQYHAKQAMLEVQKMKAKN